MESVFGLLKQKEGEWIVSGRGGRVVAVSVIGACEMQSWWLHLGTLRLEKFRFFSFRALRELIHNLN